MMCNLRSALLAICVGVMLFSFAPSVESQQAAAPFLGNWALALPNDGAGWLNVRVEKNDKGQEYLDADILWYGGSVVPVANVFVNDGRLYVVRIREIVRDKARMRAHTNASVLLLEAYGDTVAGQYIDPAQNQNGIRESEVRGKRIPAHSPAPDLSKVKFGKTVDLLAKNGLKGWEPLEKNKKNGWSVSDGVLANNPVQEKGKPHVRYANLRTVDTFEDFRLQLEVNVPKGSNSGIYLRGIYEVQVSDSFGHQLDSHNMGGIYSRITPTVSAEKAPGEWQTFDITLCDRYVTVVLNGKTIIDNQPVLGCTGGAMTSNEFIPGPIYLQGDHGAISYRNVKLTPIVR